MSRPTVKEINFADFKRILAGAATSGTRVEASDKPRWTAFVVQTSGEGGRIPRLREKSFGIAQACNHRRTRTKRRILSLLRSRRSLFKMDTAGGVELN